MTLSGVLQIVCTKLGIKVLIPLLVDDPLWVIECKPNI